MPRYSIDAVIEFVNAFVDEHELRSRCLQSSMILTAIFKKAGFTNAYPLTVSLAIYNPALVAILNKYTDRLDSPDFQEEIRSPGVIRHEIKFAGPIDSKKWAGHLVVILPNQFGSSHAMYDLTISQMNSSEYGINLQFRVESVDDAFLKGDSSYVTHMNGCMVVYYAHPDDRTYEDQDGSMRADGFDVLLAIAKVGFENAH